MYGDLVYASPGLSRDDIPKYFKDATFGVKQDGAERIYSPPGESDVSIVRDSGFGGTPDNPAWMGLECSHVLPRDLPIAQLSILLHS